MGDGGAANSGEVRERDMAGRVPRHAHALTRCNATHFRYFALRATDRAESPNVFSLQRLSPGCAHCGLLLQQEITDFL
jgi:hypothetical protein